MQIVIDLLLLTMWGVAIYLGWRRGFVRSVHRLLRWALTLLLTVLYGDAFSAWLNREFIHAPVSEVIHGKFTEMANGISEGTRDGVSALIQKIPQALHQYLEPGAERVDPSSNVHGLAHMWADSVSEGVSNAVSAVIGHILLFFLFFLLLKLGFTVAEKLVDRIFLARVIDRLLGMTAGALIGLILVVFAVAVLNVVRTLVGEETAAEGSLMLRLTDWLDERIFQ